MQVDELICVLDAIPKEIGKSEKRTKESSILFRKSLTIHTHPEKYTVWVWLWEEQTECVAIRML